MKRTLPGISIPETLYRHLENTLPVGEASTEAIEENRYLNS
ncbi:MAG TPA: hypothetical protein VJW77_14500 [Terriglobia bacterium]|nr:hypothetical protein [Terriglobia bacterium]